MRNSIGMLSGKLLVPRIATEQVMMNINKLALVGVEIRYSGNLGW
jgi:hypothetical protein